MINPTNLETERELKDHLFRTTNYREAQSLCRTNKQIQDSPNHINETQLIN